MRDHSKLSFFVNEKEYKVLLIAAEANQSYERLVKRARLVGDRYQIRLTVKQLKAFVKYLDYEKGWFDYGPQRRALRVIIARLQEFLQLMPLVVSKN